LLVITAFLAIIVSLVLLLVWEYEKPKKRLHARRNSFFDGGQV
jgi:hypothetical protein